MDKVMIEKLRSIMWATQEVIENHKDRKNIVKEGKERLEVFKEAESAMQKQVPVVVDIYESEILKCPKCGKELGYFTENGYLYCIDCGQKLKFVSGNS